MSWFYLYVLLHTLLVTLLAMNVSRLRMQLRIANGDGGDARMRKAIRAHGNAMENVLLFSMPVLALAFAGASDALLAILVLGFAVARVLHAAGMLASQFRFRQVGAGLTYLLELLGVAAVAGVLLVG